LPCLPYPNTNFGFRGITTQPMLRTLFASLLLVSGSVMAQSPAEPWTLERCIDHAFKNNITIKQTELQLNNARADLDQSRANRLPTLNASANLSLNTGRVIDPFTNTFGEKTIESNQLSLQASVPIWTGLQITNNVKAQRFGFMANMKDLEVTRNNIGLSVANFYLQVLLAQELLEIAEAQLETTQEQVVRTEKLVNAGSLSLDNLLNLKAQLGNEELNVINARNNVINSQVNLALLLQLPDPEAFRVVKPTRLEIGVVLQAEIDGVFKSALDNQPQIQAAELRTKQAQYSLAAAKGGRSPRLSAFANLSTLYSDSRLRTTGDPTLNGQEIPIGYVQGTNQIVVQPGFNTPPTEIVPRGTQFSDNLGYGFGLSLTIPILNNWQVNNQIQRARNAYTLSQLQLEGSRNQLFTDVATSVTNYRAAATRVQANERNVLAQRESYKFSELRFNEGMMNAVDYLNAKNRAQIAESNLLQSRYELLFRAKILDFYLGKPIVLN